MDKVILVEVNVWGYARDSKVKTAQNKINEYISEHNLDVISASLLRSDEDNFLFTLTMR